MERYRVVVKRIVSSDGKVVAEAKSIVRDSEGHESQTEQSVTVNISSNHSSSSNSHSSSRSRSKSDSTYTEQ